jgi:katanin p60 ATPase-containing subunit A1
LFRHLDQSLIRRLEKRILVDVPNLQERETHIKYLLPPILPHKNGHSALKCSIDYNHIAKVIIQVHIYYS